MKKEKINEVVESILNEKKDILLKRAEGLIKLDDFKLINKKKDEEKIVKFNREVDCRSLDLTGILLENKNFEEYKIKPNSLLGEQINKKLVKMYEKELRDNGYFAIALRESLILDICILKRKFLLYRFLNLPWMEAITSLIIFLGIMALAGLILMAVIVFLLLINPIFHWIVIN